MNAHPVIDKSRIAITAPEGQEEGTRSRVARWLKAVGDRVELHEPILELETDKVAMEVSAPAAGILSEIVAPEGTEAAPGAVLGHMTREDAAAPAAPQAEDTKPAEAGEEDASAESPRPRLSPLVRRLLKIHDIDPAEIQGTGVGGRIRRDDVLAYVNRRAEPEAQPAAPKEAETSIASGDSRWVPHSAMRLRIAEHMVQSLLHTAPHVTSVFEADFTRIIAHRERHKEAFARDGVKLTLTAYFVAAAAEAIKLVPEVNARFHPDGLEIFRDANIGIGTALGDKGLVVPVIRRAQTLNLFGIAEALQTLTEKARANRLAPEDMRGGTFTISNHGVSGSLVAAPIIINQPQSAILGIGKVEKRLCVVTRDGADSIEIRPKAYVTLTIDHRVLDGYQTNRFLARLVEVIETWPEDRM